MGKSNENAVELLKEALRKLAEETQQANTAQAAEPKRQRVRVQNTSNFYRTAKSGMKFFANVPEARKSTSTKFSSLRMAVMLSKSYPDEIRFFQELLNEAKPLLDSKRFEKECKAWNLMPENVAQHLVVEGKAIVNRVLKYGLMAGFGENAKLFIEPIYIPDIKPEGSSTAANTPAAAAVEVKPEGHDA